MNFVLTETNLTDPSCHTLYQAPQSTIRADNASDVPAALMALDQALDKGRYCAGYFSFELGYALEPRLEGRMPKDRALPLLWFGVFDEAHSMSEAETGKFLRAEITSAHRLSGFHPQWSANEYATRFSRVQELISAGDIYQLNLTFPTSFECEGDPVSLYVELRKRQKVSNGALIVTPDFSILSASPELFLTVKDGQVSARPMKGTAARAPTFEEDLEIINWLKKDEKSQAENLMIVDLMRNDMSRISEPGSVAVSDLYSIETHPTLHQMTSGIKAKLKHDLPFSELVRSIFPSGSVTGAPKIRAMELIAELEAGARGVYTGAIGAVAPGGDMHFNVAIRTAVIYPDGRGEIGIGSGLVADSSSEREYEECLLKMRFLTEPYEEFRLIETLLYQRGAHETSGGFVLLNRHLERLEQSAAYFKFAFDEADVRAALTAEIAKHDDPVLRVRLLLGQDGCISVASTPIDGPDPGKIMRFGISDNQVKSDNVFLYHKTTRRALFDEEFQRATGKLGFDEMVFLNERGHLTEGCITNIFVETGGKLHTPPLSSGLLAGTLRADLLDKGRAVEKVLKVDDLENADTVYLGNSVRGLVKAHFEAG